MPQLAFFFEVIKDQSNSNKWRKLTNISRITTKKSDYQNRHSLLIFVFMSIN